MYYLDANIPLNVSKGLAQVVSDILYPGALGCPVMSTIVPDVEWLRIAGEQEWVVGRSYTTSADATLEVEEGGHLNERGIIEAFY